MNDTAWDDAKRLRIRQSALDDGLSAVHGPESFPACVVAKVVSGTGPASSFYTVSAQLVTGTEADGSPGVLTDLGAHFEALNLGATIPAVGTYLICHRPSYRWVFRYG